MLQVKDPEEHEEIEEPKKPANDQAERPERQRQLDSDHEWDVMVPASNVVARDLRASGELRAQLPARRLYLLDLLAKADKAAKDLGQFGYVGLCWVIS
jgi:hypothetical protein